MQPAPNSRYSYSSEDILTVLNAYLGSQGLTAAPVGEAAENPIPLVNGSCEYQDCDLPAAIYQAEAPLTYTDPTNGQPYQLIICPSVDKAIVGFALKFERDPPTNAMVQHNTIYLYLQDEQLECAYRTLEGIGRQTIQGLADEHEVIKKAEDALQLAEPKLPDEEYKAAISVIEEYLDLEPISVIKFLDSEDEIDGDHLIARSFFAHVDLAAETKYLLLIPYRPNENHWNLSLLYLETGEQRRARFVCYEPMGNKREPEDCADQPPAGKGSNDRDTVWHTIRQHIRAHGFQVDSAQVHFTHQQHNVNCGATTAENAKHFLSGGGAFIPDESFRTLAGSRALRERHITEVGNDIFTTQASIVSPTPSVDKPAADSTSTRPPKRDRAGQPSSRSMVAGRSTSSHQYRRHVLFPNGLTGDLYQIAIAMKYILAAYNEGLQFGLYTEEASSDASGGVGKFDDIVLLTQAKQDNRLSIIQVKHAGSQVSEKRQYTVDMLLGTDEVSKQARGKKAALHMYFASWFNVQGQSQYDGCTVEFVFYTNHHLDKHAGRFYDPKTRRLTKLLEKEVKNSEHGKKIWGSLRNIRAMRLESAEENRDNISVTWAHWQQDQWEGLVTLFAAELAKKLKKVNNSSTLDITLKGKFLSPDGCEKAVREIRFQQLMLLLIGCFDFNPDENTVTLTLPTTRPLPPIHERFVAALEQRHIDLDSLSGCQLRLPGHHIRTVVGITKQSMKLTTNEPPHWTISLKETKYHWASLFVGIAETEGSPGTPPTLPADQVGFERLPGHIDLVTWLADIPEAKLPTASQADALIQKFLEAFEFKVEQPGLDKLETELLNLLKRKHNLRDESHFRRLYHELIKNFRKSAGHSFTVEQVQAAFEQASHDIERHRLTGRTQAYIAQLRIYDDTTGRQGCVDVVVQEQLASFNEWYRSQKRLLIIQGDAHIGKSFTVAAWLDEMQRAEGCVETTDSVGMLGPDALLDEDGDRFKDDADLNLFVLDDVDGLLTHKRTLLLTFLKTALTSSTQKRLVLICRNASALRRDLSKAIMLDRDWGDDTDPSTDPDSPEQHDADQPGDKTNDDDSDSDQSSLGDDERWAVIKTSLGPYVQARLPDIRRVQEIGDIRCQPLTDEQISRLLEVPLESFDDPFLAYPGVGTDEDGHPSLSLSEALASGSHLARMLRNPGLLLQVALDQEIANLPDQQPSDGMPYVEPRVQIIPMTTGKDRSKKKSAPRTEKDGSWRHELLRKTKTPQHGLVEDGAGMGKTTQMRKLSSPIFQPNTLDQFSWRIPIYLDQLHDDDIDLDLEDLIVTLVTRHYAAEHGYHQGYHYQLPTWLEAALRMDIRHEDVILLADGAEQVDVQMYERLRPSFQKLLEYPHIIVFSRPGAQLTIDPDFIIKMEDFGREEILSFFTQAFTHQEDQEFLPHLTSQLWDDHLVSALNLGTPLQCVMFLGAFKGTLDIPKGTFSSEPRIQDFLDYIASISSANDMRAQLYRHYVAQKLLIWGEEKLGIPRAAIRPRLELLTHAHLSHMQRSAFTDYFPDRHETEGYLPRNTATFDDTPDQQLMDDTVNIALVSRQAEESIPDKRYIWSQRTYQEYLAASEFLQLILSSARLSSPESDYACGLMAYIRFAEKHRQFWLFVSSHHHQLSPEARERFRQAFMANPELIHGYEAGYWTVLTGTDDVPDRGFYKPKKDSRMFNTVSQEVTKPPDQDEDDSDIGLDALQKPRYGADNVTRIIRNYNGGSYVRHDSNLYECIVDLVKHDDIPDSDKTSLLRHVMLGFHGNRPTPSYRAFEAVIMALRRMDLSDSAVLRVLCDAPRVATKTRRTGSGEEYLWRALASPGLQLPTGLPETEVASLFNDLVEVYVALFKSDTITNNRYLACRQLLTTAAHYLDSINWQFKVSETAPTFRTAVKSLFRYFFPHMQTQDITAITALAHKLSPLFSDNQLKWNFTQNKERILLLFHLVEATLNGTDLEFDELDDSIKDVDAERLDTLVTTLVKCHQDELAIQFLTHWLYKHHQNRLPKSALAEASLTELYNLKKSFCSNKQPDTDLSGITAVANQLTYPLAAYIVYCMHDNREARVESMRSHVPELLATSGFHANQRESRQLALTTYQIFLRQHALDDDTPQPVSGGLRVLCEHETVSAVDAVQYAWDFYRAYREDAQATDLALSVIKLWVQCLRWPLVQAQTCLILISPLTDNIRLLRTEESDCTDIIPYAAGFFQSDGTADSTSGVEEGKSGSDTDASDHDDVDDRGANQPDRKRQRCKS